MKQPSIRSRIMDFVSANGPMKRTRIIKFIIETFHPERGPYQSTRDRGYCCDNFYSSPYYYCSPLKSDHRYLAKNDDGLYYVEYAKYL